MLPFNGPSVTLGIYFSQAVFCTLDRAQIILEHFDTSTECESNKEATIAVLKLHLKCHFWLPNMY